MYKPKVEFYNHFICLLPWPTDLKAYYSNLLHSVYVRQAKFERNSIANDRKIAERIFFFFLSLWPWPLTYPSENVIN